MLFFIIFEDRVQVSRGAPSCWSLKTRELMSTMVESTLRLLTTTNYVEPAIEAIFKLSGVGFQKRTKHRSIRDNLF